MPSENKMKASDKVLIDLHSVFHGGGPEEAASVCAHCWPSLNSTPAWQVSGINLKDRSGVYNMHFLLFILNDSVEGTVFAQTSSNFAMRKEASNTSPTAELLQVLYSLAKMKKSENSWIEAPFNSDFVANARTMSEGWPLSEPQLPEEGAAECACPAFLSCMQPALGMSPAGR